MQYYAIFLQKQLEKFRLLNLLLTIRKAKVVASIIFSQLHLSVFQYFSDDNSYFRLQIQWHKRLLLRVLPSS